MGEASIRRAGLGDAAAVAEVFLRSFHAALPTIRLAHTDDEVRGWYAAVVLPDPGRQTWLAEDNGAAVGMMVLGNETIEQLYLLPDVRGAGLGDRFLDIAKRRRPGGLSLYAFQVNGPARRFYERHGFRAVEFGDGSGNEEGEPDVRYAWTPAHPGR